MKSFGSKDLINCLLCLGFTPTKSTGSSHIKYKCTKSVEKGTRSFIEVILNVKTYDPTTRGRYLTQIKRLGYSLKEIEKCMK